MARYTLQNHYKNKFFQLPKFLFDEQMKELNNDSRILYAVLRERHEQSVKNGWVDAEGHIYLFCSRDDMCDLLNVSKPTVIKAFNLLKKCNLIEEERQGLGKPNKVYLLTFTPSSKESLPLESENNENMDESGKNSLLQEVKDVDDGVKEILPQEVKNVDCIKTNINKTDVSNTKKSNKKSRPDDVYTQNQATNETTLKNDLINYTTEDRQNKDTNEEINEFFNKIWELYPKKRGKDSIKSKRKKELHSVGFEKLERAISRYKNEIKNRGVQDEFVLNGSTFFNGRYKEFLDENYKEVKKYVKKNGFNNFTQPSPDYALIEKLQRERLQKMIRESENSLC